MVAMGEREARIGKARVSIVREWGGGVPFAQALRLVEGRPMISNKEADLILQDPGLMAGLIAIFPVWTGTVVAYNAPGKRLGSTIAANGLVIDVPARYRNAVDCALFVNHPNFTLTLQRRGYLIASNLADLVAGFPSADGWFRTDSVTGIPNGENATGSDSKARYFFRSNGSYVGPLVRNLVDANDSGRLITANYGLDCLFGVACVARRR